MSVSRRRQFAALVLTTATAAATLAVGVVGTTSATAATAPAKVPGASPCCGSAFLVPGRALWRHSPDHPAESSLVSLGLAASGTSSYAPTQLDGYLVLQDDGNLVEYSSSTHQVLFTTHTTTGARLVFQNDRNVVLYDDHGHALWATGTAGSTAAFFGPYGNGQLVTQRADGTVVSAAGTATTTAPGVSVASASSPNGRYSLAVQSDGNLVEYAASAGGPRAIWNSRTAGRGAVRLAAQSDGNLVLYSRTTGAAVWASRTRGPAAYHQLDVQDDGNVVLYRTDGVHRLQAVWASGLHG